MVTGLAWTEVGGELLTIEGVMMPGRGDMNVTGNLGDVMKELIQAAMPMFAAGPSPLASSRRCSKRRTSTCTCRRAPRRRTGRRPALPWSPRSSRVLTGIPVRRDVAMTGEITLRGRVLPIGGLKEKLLAALRGGIKRVIIPEENAKDLAEIPDNVKNALEIIPVARMDEVLAIALTRKLEPIEWDEAAALAAAAKMKDMGGPLSADSSGGLPH